MPRVAILAVVGVLFLTAPSFAQFWPPTHIPPDRDNTLYEDPDGALSNGAGQYFFTGRTDDPDGLIRRGAVHFDIYSVWPPSVFEMFYYPNLTLHVSEAPAYPVAVSLHRLLRPWGEGTSDAPDDESGGAPSSPLSATWLHSFYSAEFWDKPGGDFVEIPSATITISDTGYCVVPSNPILEDDLQFWYCTPDSNYGWILIGDESAAGTVVRFDSREHPDSTRQPRLDYGFATCDCWCDYAQGDLDKDGFLTAIDLGLLIDELFAGAAIPLCCGHEMSDIDCSGFTDPLDLALMIDILFQGAWTDCEVWYMYGECGEVCGGWKAGDNGTVKRLQH